MTTTNTRKRNSVDFRCLTISAGNGKRIQDQEHGWYRRQYVVTIKSDATGATRRFTFTGSAHDEEQGRIGLAGNDLLWAFRCFVDDAACGSGTFGEFASDFGYDPDSWTARRTWLACRSAGRRFAELWVNPPDFADVLNELSDMGVE